MLRPTPDNKGDTETPGDPVPAPAASDAAAHAQNLHTLVLSLSHGLESLRRQLHEQQAAGEALRADLAAQTEANKALVGDADALRSMLADLDVEAKAQREAISRTQEAVEARLAASAQLLTKAAGVEKEM